MTILQRLIKRFAPISKRQALLDLENSSQAVYRFVRFRSARRRIFRREIISVSWRYDDAPRFLALGEADFQITSLRTNHCHSGRCCICQTSLYEFVRSHVHGEGSKDPYRDHLVRRYGYDEHEVTARVTEFESLIDAFVNDPWPVRAVVVLKSTSEAMLLDGAHRVSIVHAVTRESVIRCSVVYRSVN